MPTLYIRAEALEVISRPYVQLWRDAGLQWPGYAEDACPTWVILRNIQEAIVHAETSSEVRNELSACITILTDRPEDELWTVTTREQGSRSPFTNLPPVRMSEHRPHADTPPSDDTLIRANRGLLDSLGVAYTTTRPWIFLSAAAALAGTGHLDTAISMAGHAITSASASATIDQSNARATFSLYHSHTEIHDHSHTEIHHNHYYPSSSQSSSATTPSPEQNRPSPPHNPRGLLSDDLPSLGVTYQSKQISLVITSMISAAEISEIKVMSSVKIALETKDCITLDGIVTELFSAKTLILPMELCSKDGSHWVFLVIDAQLGMVKLLDTENAHETVVRDFLSHFSLSTWQFSTLNVDHQQYSDSCGVEGVSQLIAYLKNTTAIDPASAAVVQSITHLDYLIGALGSIFNVDQFYRVKDFAIEQLNKAINFALDSNNQGLVIDLFHQAGSLQDMCPIPLGDHPFKPDHDGSFEGGSNNQQNRPEHDSPISLTGNINGTIYDGQGAHE